MPNYTGHLAGGSIAFALALALIAPAQKLTLLTTIEWLLCALAGSLFPDIDIKSKGQKYFYLLILLGLIALLATNRITPFIIVSILALTPMLSKHRGIFHRTWFVVGLPLLVWQIVALEYPAMGQPLWFDTLFFIAGAISHLWLDMGWRKMLKI